ncbi:MAG: ABC transporter substrate-binding protein [Bacteroidota bacterium]|nr:ABC transporter substrate-binding protein [Bacteroidota bacterium]
MKTFHLPVLIGAFLLTSFLNGCVNTERHRAKADHAAYTNEPLRYAREFSIKNYSTFKVLEVRNAWDTLHALARYVLVPRKNPLPPHLPEGIVIRTPVQSFGCATSVDACMAAKLGVLPLVNAVAEKDYLHQPYLDEQFKKGKITEIGSSMNINAEKLMRANPQILFVSPFKDNKYGHLKQTGVPLIQIANYLENHPLGRAEWILFYGAFFEKEELAQKIFDSISCRYEQLAGLTRNLSSRPTIFSGKLYGNLWYMAGGKSYPARFFKDAGSNYIWANRPETVSFPLDFETVYQKAINADYWQILDFYNGTYTYQNLKTEYPPYSNFKAFQKKKVIFCNTHYSDYYEQGLLEPDIILADLINILHPGILKNHIQKYFSLLK